MLFKNLPIFLISFFNLQLYGFCELSNSTYVDTEVGNRSEILSRRKRFLIFPEGSSVQLVFCLTFPMVFTIGDIFLYGYTSALAYELPQDPYSPFRHHADPLHRRTDSKVLYFTDDEGKVLFQRPYIKKLIVNPAFAKRSVDAKLKANSFEKKEFKTERQRMHSLKREFLKNRRSTKRSIEFHRSGRASLYPKIETMFQAMGGNGRECLLKTLCVVGQADSKSQGYFLQEILRAVFTLHKGLEFEDDYHKAYDKAFTATEPCDTLFPECTEPLSDPTSANFSY